MGFWGSLFGVKSVVENVPKVVDGVISGVDKLCFTEEEKAEVNIKTMELIFDHIKTSVSESSIRSITRRVLSICILGVFLLLLLASGGLFYFFPAWAQYLFDCAKSMYHLVLAVSVFYFGPYQLARLTKK